MTDFDGRTPLVMQVFADGGDVPVNIAQKIPSIGAILSFSLETLSDTVETQNVRFTFPSLASRSLLSTDASSNLEANKINSDSVSVGSVARRAFVYNSWQDKIWIIN